MTTIQTTADRAQAYADYTRSVIDTERSGRSKGTEHELAKHWKAFSEWITDQGDNPNDAIPEAVGAYLVSQFQDGKSLSTIRARRWAISTHFGGKGVDGNPASSTHVSAVMREITHQLGERAQRQAAPLDADAIAAIVKTACNPRRMGAGYELPRSAAMRGLQDIAIAYVLSDGGLRRSEAAALTWGDISAGDDGTGLMFIARSKTDQTGLGAVVGLTPGGYAALIEYRNSRYPRRLPPDTASVFNLGAYSISRRVKQMATAAGLKGNFSGHSGRVGMAVRAARSGVSVSEVMNQGRWKSLNMVARYQQPITADEFAKRLQ